MVLWPKYLETELQTQSDKNIFGEIYHELTGSAVNNYFMNC